MQKDVTEMTAELIREANNAAKKSKDPDGAKAILLALEAVVNELAEIRRVLHRSQ